MLDGSNNDDGWGRQTMITTVPAGSVQEVGVLSNAFSAEFDQSKPVKISGEIIRTFNVTQSAVISAKGYTTVLASAVFLDAFVVRSLLLPAVLTLLGPRTWALPGPFERRLPRIAIEAVPAAD